MGSLARFTIGIATAFSAVAFAVIGMTLGPSLPGGSTPLYAMAAFCGVASLACLHRASRPLTLRLVGATVFVTFVIYAYRSLGTQNADRAIAGLLALGLPGLYVAATGKYPSWGQASTAFNAESQSNHAETGTNEDVAP
jgi:hypothetical protein